MSSPQISAAGFTVCHWSLSSCSCSGCAAELVEGLRELLHSVRGADEVEDVDPRWECGRCSAGDGGLLERDEGGESAEEVVSIHAGTVSGPPASRPV